MFIARGKGQGQGVESDGGMSWQVGGQGRPTHRTWRESKVWGCAGGVGLMMGNDQYCENGCKSDRLKLGVKLMFLIKRLSFEEYLSYF